MSICSLIVHVAPGQHGQVGRSLAALEGVEVHATSKKTVAADREEPLVVTIDQRDDKRAAQTLEQINHISGVLSTSLIYTYFEENHAERECQS